LNQLSSKNSKIRFKRRIIYTYCIQISKTHYTGE